MKGKAPDTIFLLNTAYLVRLVNVKRVIKCFITTINVMFSYLWMLINLELKSGNIYMTMNV